MCRTVRFDAALATAAADPEVVLLELGPGQALSSVASQVALTDAPGALAIPAMRSAATKVPGRAEPPGEHADLLEALGRFWAQGGHVDWASLSSAETGRLVKLPTYPFQHQRFWPDTPAALPEGPTGRPCGLVLRADVARRPWPCPAASGQRWLVVSGGSCWSSGSAPSFRHAVPRSPSHHCRAARTRRLEAATPTHVLVPPPTACTGRRARRADAFFTAMG